MRAASRAAAVLLALGLVAVSAAPASAHNYLVASTPAEGSTITELPAEFSVTTNESLLDLAGDGSGFAMEVVDSAGAYYGDGCVTIVDATMSTAAALGPAGDYRMLYQLVSADGHTVSGELGFTWAPAADAQLSVGADSPPNCGGTVSEAPGASTAPETRSDADLSDVLWIGGTVAAVLVAALVTFLVLGRRKTGN